MKHILLRGLLIGLLVNVWLFGGFTILSLLITSVPHVILRTLTGALGLVILFTGIYYAMRSQRQRQGAAGYTYLQALGTGVCIAVIVAVMVSIVSGVYVYVNPGFTQDMANEAATSLRQSGASQVVIDQKLAGIKNAFSLRQQMLNPLMVQTAMGTVFSLIAAAFMKVKKQQQ